MNDLGAHVFDEILEQAMQRCFILYGRPSHVRSFIDEVEPNSAEEMDTREARVEHSAVETEDPPNESDPVKQELEDESLTVESTAELNSTAALKEIAETYSEETVDVTYAVSPEQEQVSKVQSLYRYAPN